MERIQGKYIPKKSGDLIIEKSIVKDVARFLTDFDKPKCKANLIIQGESGVGKTTLIRTLLEEKGFQIKIPFDCEPTKKRTRKKTKDNSKKKKENDVIAEHYSAMCKNADNSAMNLFFDIPKETSSSKPIAFLLDNEDSYLIDSNPNYIRMLARINDKFKKVPFIMVTDNSHKKIINLIKNVIEKIVINYPSYSHTKNMIETIANKEDIVFASPIVIDKIIDTSLGDIRKIYQFLDDFKVVFAKQSITEQIADKYFSEVQLANKQKSIFDKTKILFTEYLGIEETYRQYIADKTILPLILNFNYLSHISRQAGHLTCQQKLKLMKKISGAMAFGESIDSYIFSGQVWDIQNLHCISTCTYPSLLISSIPNKKNYKESFPFPLDLHKMGVKMTNRKNITLTQKQNIYDINVEDLIHIIRIIKRYLQNIKELEKRRLEFKNKKDKQEEIRELQKLEYNKISILAHKYHLSHKIFGKLYKIDADPNDKTKTKELTALKSYFPKEIS
jgi:DNA polymerase III delta prime subunit